MNILYAAILSVNLFSPYISSWMVSVLPFPPGAILRDVLNALFVVLVLIRFLVDRKKIHFFLVFTIFAWGSLVLWVIALTIFSSDKVQAIMGGRSYILFPAVFIALAILKVCYSESLNVEKVVRYIIFLMLTVAVIAIIDVLMKGELIKLLGYDEHYAGDQLNLINSYDGMIRATGGFSDALNFGYMLTLGVLLCMECFSQGYKRAWMLIASLVIFTAICMTLTRGAILVAVIIYAFYIISNRKMLLSGITLFLIVIPILMVSTNIFDKYIDTLVGRFTDSSQTSRGSTQGRIDMAMNSLSYLSEHPSGIGLGTQGSGNMLSVKDNRLNTDNYFFWMALETGIVGLIINIFYMASQFYASFSLDRRYNTHPSYACFRIYFLLGITFFISAALSSAPSSSTFSIYYWTVLALMPFWNLSNRRCTI
ncbi:MULTISPECIES: O-antigen ligase family protein [Citrobacter]|uniref:O-antigen ligase family protein n=1 Tax=Citrobacter TaxID=544 RepID=UPI0025776D40|nr:MULTISPECIES: O-antigen ligase family protein [Citrobacter]